MSPDAFQLTQQAKGLYSAGQVVLALETALQGAARYPDNADFSLLAGVAAAALGKPEDAEAHYRRAIALDSRYAAAYCNLGLLLASRGRDGEAEGCYRQALALAPDQAETCTNLGLLLERQGRDDEAELCQRQALLLKPDSPEILTNLANLLAKRQRDAEAEEHYRRAIELAPAAPATYANFGTLLADGGREAEAEGCFRQAIALRPDYPLARLNLSYLLLAQGRFAEGWALHEARYDSRLADRATLPPAVAYPRWQGESLAGKSLLVWPEQGFGDEIQFCRFLPLLKARGAGPITLACKTALKPLLATLAGVDAVVAADAGPAAISPHDYWTFPLSLPLHCQWDIGDMASPVPYLRALPERLARWAPRLPADGLRVGIVWKGNGRNPNDAERSLPSLTTLGPLWSVPGVRFVSLQKGSGEAEAAPPPTDQPLTHLGAAIADFADTAAIVAQLDLVICVDTAVAHLAGALGKPCWVLLPACKTDWRWLQGRQDSPWYPSLRLFRQQRRGQWGPVVEELRQALKACIHGPSPVFKRD